IKALRSYKERYEERQTVARSRNGIYIKKAMWWCVKFPVHLSAMLMGPPYASSLMYMTSPSANGPRRKVKFFENNSASLRKWKPLVDWQAALRLISTIFLKSLKVTASSPLSNFKKIIP